MTTLSQSQQVKQLAENLVQKLNGVTDEPAIKELVVKAWQKLKKLISNENSFNRSRTEFRKIVESKFPHSTEPKAGYYFTTEGKGKIVRYQHLALWYATTNEARWEVMGDAARAAYFGNLPQFPQPEVQPETQQQTEVTLVPTPELTIEDMKVEQLGLDADTQQTVQDAIAHSGMKLSEFVQQACKVYAATVMGKAKQADMDLESIPTTELLNNPKYRTLPGRAEQLTMRAIQAIMGYNDNCTEKSQKWCITASAINALTGSKMALIKQSMAQCHITIDDHNAKHGLNAYDNRGRQISIEQDIDFVGTERKITTPVKEDSPVTREKPISAIKPPVLKVQEMSLNSSTIEIWDHLSQNPGIKVRIRDGRKAIHYLPVTDDAGNLTAMQSEETGELVTIP